MTAMRSVWSRGALIRYTKCLLYNLTALPLGVFYSVALLTAFTFSAVLWVFWIGVPILWLTFGLAWSCAQFERGLANSLLDTRIRYAPRRQREGLSFARKCLAHLKERTTWLGLVYLTLKLPWGILVGVIALVTIASLALGILVPLTYWFAPLEVFRTSSGDGWLIDTFLDALAASVSLTLLAAGLLALNVGLASVARWFTIGMLTPTHFERDAREQARTQTERERPVIAKMPHLPAPMPVPVTAARAMARPSEPDDKTTRAAGPEVVHAAERPPVDCMMDILTDREVQVVTLLAEGLTNRNIADRLFVSEGTVKRHTHNIYRKLDVNNRTQAVVRARDLGMLQ